MVDGENGMLAITAMEKLDIIYCCKSCRAGFLFKSDVTEHKMNECHYEFEEIPLDFMQSEK